MAIVPIVLDAINFIEVEHHEWKSYGGWSWALSDYYEMNLTVSIFLIQCSTRRFVLHVPCVATHSVHIMVLCNLVFIYLILYFDHSLALMTRTWSTSRKMLTPTGTATD
jgi:hypothetical protein